MIKILTEESDYLKTFINTPALFLAAGVTFVLLTGCSTMKKPENIAPPEALTVCKNSPNCVSSTDERSKFYIAPIQIHGQKNHTQEQVMAQIIDILTNKMGLNVTIHSAQYVHAEAVSTFFRFVDDIELMINDDLTEIQLRSSSRVGYSDFGVNRKRMEAFKQHWHTIETPTEPQ